VIILNSQNSLFINIKNKEIKIIKIDSIKYKLDGVKKVNI
jgi:hypothetical protein